METRECVPLSSQRSVDAANEYEERDVVLLTDPFRFGGEPEHEVEESELEQSNELSHFENLDRVVLSHLMQFLPTDDQISLRLVSKVTQRKLDPILYKQLKKNLNIKLLDSLMFIWGSGKFVIKRKYVAKRTRQDYRERLDNVNLQINELEHLSNIDRKLILQCLRLYHDFFRYYSIRNGTTSFWYEKKILSNWLDIVISIIDFIESEQLSIAETFKIKCLIKELNEQARYINRASSNNLPSRLEYILNVITLASHIAIGILCLANIGLFIAVMATSSFVALQILQPLYLTTLTGALVSVLLLAISWVVGKLINEFKTYKNLHTSSAFISNLHKRFEDIRYEHNAAKKNDDFDFEYEPSGAQEESSLLDLRAC